MITTEISPAELTNLTKFDEQIDSPAVQTIVEDALSYCIKNGALDTGKLELALEWVQKFGLV